MSGRKVPESEDVQDIGFESRKMDPLGSPEAREAFHDHQDCLMQVWRQEQKLRYAYTFLAVCVLATVVYIAGPQSWHLIFGRTAWAVLLIAISIYVVTLRRGLRDARTAKDTAWSKCQKAADKIPMA